MPTPEPTVASVRNVDAGPDRSRLLDAARVAIAIGRQEVGPVLIQRRLHLGYAAARRMLDLLEDAGVIGQIAATGSHPVLVPAAQLDAVLAVLAEERSDDAA